MLMFCEFQILDFIELEKGNIYCERDSQAQWKGKMMKVKWHANTFNESLMLALLNFPTEYCNVFTNQLHKTAQPYLHFVSKTVFPFPHLLIINCCY